MNIFSSDGWFARVFGTIGDIIVVNILFIICSIPIFTMGASMPCTTRYLRNNGQVRTEGL